MGTMLNEAELAQESVDSGNFNEAALRGMRLADGRLHYLLMSGEFVGLPFY